MKVLLLGVGMQGKAALYDLVMNDEVTEITAADRDVAALRSHVEKMGYGTRVTCETVDAADTASLRRLMEAGADVVIDLLPVPFIELVTRTAIEVGVDIVNTFYVTPELAELKEDAKAAGITILPEFGMDPGIDLVLLGDAVRSMDMVDGIVTYGAGFPEPAAADNPLKYKVTWTFEGVLRSYLRPGRVVRGGEIIDIGETEMFAEQNMHEVDIEGLGRLEAFPNADSLKYLDVLGLPVDGMQEMGRYVLRWPGHCAFWKTLADLHLLDGDDVVVDGVPVNKSRFLAAVLEPQLQYTADERDAVVVRIEVSGTRNGRRGTAVYQVIDYRDLDTGFTAMSRTVGYTASIGAQMVARGDVKGTGFLSPVNDVPFRKFASELEKRGIAVTTEFVESV